MQLHREDFLACFGKKAFRIGHYLVGHPLFELPKLIELSKALPLDRVEYNAGTLPIEQNPALTPHNGLSVEETIRRIEECNSWMVLKNVEKHPEYAKLLSDCLDEVKPLSESVDPGMGDRVGFIFISSAGATTPFHMDPEYNFLLQVRGSKRVHMWDPADRNVVPESCLENYFGNMEAHRNLPYQDAFAPLAWVNDLQPGDGLHFPYMAPHWVKNGDGVSISFSITFQTPKTRNLNLAYTINSRLRRLGIQPTPVGKSALADTAKRMGFQILQNAKRLVVPRKSEPSEPLRKY